MSICGNGTIGRTIPEDVLLLDESIAQCGTMLYNVVHYGTMWYNVVQCGTMLYIVVHYGTMWYNVVQCGTMWYNMAVFILSSQVPESSDEPF